MRDHNEDFVDYREPVDVDEELKNGWLYIVADGVGGSEAGEVASQYATERTIHHYLANSNTSDWGQRLREAMQAANAELRDLVVEHSAGNRMATTMVAAVLHDSIVTLANVGDSRGYLWRDGLLRQITKDQSLVARLLEEGAITEEEAENHPRKNVILHSLGSESTPRIDLYDVSLTPGERLILCTDGLTRHVSDDEMASIVGDYSPGEATRELIELANDRGGEDNISVGILHIGELPAQSQVSVNLVSDSATAQKSLWIYTAFLCIVQTVLIFLIWFLIAS